MKKFDLINKTKKSGRIFLDDIAQKNDPLLKLIILMMKLQLTV